MKIVVVGAGYVGLVTAACLAEIGHEVVCIDIQKEKIENLKNGKSPIYEPGLEEMIKRNKKRLTFSTENKEYYKTAEAIFIAVGTPEKKDGSANLKYVFQVAKDIAKSVEDDCVVIIKSTVPIGTNSKIEKLIKCNLNSDINVEIVSNPEFLSQGTAIKDTLEAQRIVLGVASTRAEKFMKNIYDKMKIPYVITDRNSAEMIKYASNDFLALKISYINEIANLCEIVGANIEDVAKGMGMDKRIGNKFLNAGIGYGGSCFPKDTKALHWLATFNDYELKTIKATIEINSNQKIRLLKKAKKYYDCFEGKNVAILGATFKPNTDDLRESPILDNIPILIEEGATIKIFDPVANEKIKEIYKNDIRCCNTIEETLENADICFIFTDWDCIRRIDKNLFKKMMNNPIIIDGRNCFDLKDIPEDVIYESIGRKTINNNISII